MANAKNLIQGNPATEFQSGREAVENGRKGGIASGKSRRQAKTMAEIAKQIAAAAPNKKNKEVLKELGIKASEATNSAVVTASVFKQAARGNIAAVDKWQQLTEDQKEEEREFLLPAREIGRAFVDINRQISPNREYVFRGGRGSGKSSFIGFKSVELLMNHPDMNMVAVRKVANTMRDSVFAQIKWCIIELGLEDKFRFTTSPLEITLIKTGQKIYFRGADDPAKLKSLKPDKGYIGILWLEEADQFDGENELRDIQQSVMRGEGEEFYLFKSFNPPKSRKNFMNRYVEERKANMVVHSSNYLDTPQEWLGSFFLDEAEHLREVNPVAYENEYMGVANGAGGLVFENLADEEITDEQISHFDRIYQGVDWGWYPDQFAFARMHFDADEDILYIFDELYGNKLPNDVTGQWIIDHSYDDFVITCDTAEPKSVGDYVGMGLPAHSAVKGPGSVEYGFKWLQRRKKIVIDSRRCPNAYREFSEYEYEKDKDGNDISGYPDGNDHEISAVRYALERTMRRRENRA